MVIERALEKLKQSQAAGMAASSPQAERRANHAPDRRAARAPLNEAPPAPRLQFPELVCSGESAMQNRILLPGTPLATEGHVGAAYRIIRARLQNLITTNNWTTLAITSPDPGEGKSVTALNLALSFSRDETKRVFLIDLDMRNPTICKYLGVQPPHTLLEYFGGGCPPESVFFSVGTDNLAIAGNVETTDLASELLASDRLERLFDCIRSMASNALILIDLPPILVTDEALLMAPRVDATALVVADGQTRRDSLLRARQLLADFSFAGVILNKSSESVGKAGYYYGYGPRDK